VLLVGGWSGNAATTTCELFDPVHRTSALVGSVHGATRSAVPLLLADGKVLVTAEDADFAEVGAELFDPAHPDRWTVLEPRRHPRSYHATVLLPSGKILVAGGYAWDTSVSPAVARYPLTAELYDPATGHWSDTGDLHARHVYVQEGAVLLAGGEVLVAGGQTDVPSWSVTSMVEEYDPATGLWSIAGALTYPRGNHTLTVLSDGRVMAVGGGPDVPNRAELWTEP
jgi:hypothetical protein